MSILDDIQNGKQVSAKKTYEIDEDSVNLLSKICSDTLASNQRIVDKINDIKGFLGSSSEPTSMQPPPIQKTSDVPYGYLINERTNRQEMEDGTWKLEIVIETLTIDDLIKPDDFSSVIVYNLRRDKIIRSTPKDTYPGFRIIAKVGLITVSKRVIEPCISKEEAMHSPKFLSNLQKVLELIKSKSH